MSFELGKIISHFRVLEKIGAGGMGEVYLAEDLELNRKVALKFLLSHQNNDLDIQSRFKREAKAIAALNHPNILTVYEVGKHDNYLFIAMEYIEGKSLDELINQDLLPIPKVVEIAVQICKGMDAAHQNEIIHRDIKPANILIESSGQVKLVDFGLAKLKNMNQLTKASSALGTLNYMSPEQIQNMDVDKRSDIFSFGIVLYQMITGHLPFEGKYEAATTYSILNDEPEPLDRYKSGISNQLQHIVDKSLSKDRNNRYQSVSELLADLNEISKESEKISQVRPKKRFPSRRPLLLGLSLLLLVTILILFTTQFSTLFRTDKPIPEMNETSAQNQFQNSVAVLPFENMSSDPEQEYFCDGMTEQIITNLSQLQKLKVIARTSVMKFKDTKKTIPEIAEELGVATILEGSIRKYGNRVRVTAQLVQTDQVFNLWENDYDIQLQNLFAVQDEVSEEIAEKLLNKLTLAEEKNLKTEEPKNVDSYEYYLQGVYFLKKKYWITRKLEDFLQSEEMFKKAIEYDSTYALAYAGLADLYNEVDIFNPFFKKDSNNYIDLQEKYIKKAYNLNPNSGYINRVKANVHEFKNETKQAFESFKRALELNPNESTINYDMGFFLSKRGLYHQADKYFAKAAELDPVSFKNYRNRGIISFNLGKLNKAIEYLQTALEFESDDIPTRLWLARSKVLLNKYKEAEEELKICESIDSGPQEPAILKTRALLSAAEGNKEEAINLLKISGFTDKYSKISVYSLLGMKDEALMILDSKPIAKLGNQYGADYLIMQHNLIFTSIRDTNEFKEALQKAKEIYTENLITYQDAFL